MASVGIACASTPRRNCGTMIKHADACTATITIHGIALYLLGQSALRVVKILSSIGQLLERRDDASLVLQQGKAKSTIQGDLHQHSDKKRQRTLISLRRSSIRITGLTSSKKGPPLC